VQDAAQCIAVFSLKRRHHFRRDVYLNSGHRDPPMLLANISYAQAVIATDCLQCTSVLSATPPPSAISAATIIRISESMSSMSSILSGSGSNAASRVTRSKCPSKSLQRCGDLRFDFMGAFPTVAETAPADSASSFSDRRGSPNARCKKCRCYSIILLSLDIGPDIGRRRPTRFAAGCRSEKNASAMVPSQTEVHRNP
jgi:hypothetical protein